MPKILHLATDEKFINSANWSFEKVAPNQNKFFIIVPKAHTKLKYVSKKENIQILKDNKNTERKILKQLHKYDLIVLHGLDFFKSRIVLKSDNDIKFLWILWGFEIYNNPFAFRANIFGTLTSQYFIKRKKNDFIKNIVKTIKYRLSNGVPEPNKAILKAAKKVTYLGILHKEDFDNFKNNLIINNKAEYVKFTYYPLEFIFKGSKELTISGDDILLGNSSSESNNHLEAFDLLKKISIGNRKIITPLSYGKKEYAEKIVELGKKQFGNNFQPLLEFLSLNEYNKTVQNCGIVIMNSYRQQAVGNIIAMMWMGAKIYLDERNTFFQYLKRIGCFVYSINKDLNSNNSDVFSLLTKQQIFQNRKILIEEIGSENVLRSFKHDLEIIINKQ